jgi:alkylation response protein AidB-like acyl-CoA dehydrogenase
VSRQDSLDEGVVLETCRPVVPPGATVLENTSRVHLQLLLAATASGVAGEALRLAVGHARQRKQFGVAIGTFQAVKHRCVDMAIRHEAAVSSVRLAAVRADAGIWDDMVWVASMCASRAARENSADAIQIFGGMGFTVEAGIHHLLRRGWLLERLMGPSAVIADALVTRNLADAAS